MTKLIAKTHAKSIFCLADKDIDALPAVEKRNPRSRNGPPMKLYDKAQLEAAAHRKWGGPEGLAKEQRKREERRMARAATAAAVVSSGVAAGVAVIPPEGASAASANADETSRRRAAALGPVSISSNFAWLGLSPLVSERIREVLPFGEWTPVAADAAAGAAPPLPLAKETQQPRTTDRPAFGGSEVEVVDLAGNSSSGGDEDDDDILEKAAGSRERGPMQKRRRQLGLEADAKAIIIVSSASGSESGSESESEPNNDVDESERRDGSIVGSKLYLPPVAGIGSVGGGTQRRRSQQLACDGSIAAPLAKRSEAIIGKWASGSTTTTTAAATTVATSAAARASLATTHNPVAMVSGGYVLYWMKTAVRGHENPALDAARAAAERLGLPLRIAAFVQPACQPYVNHRRVKFLLEGLRDAQRELRDQSLDLLVYVYGSVADGVGAAATAAATAATAAAVAPVPAAAGPGNGGAGCRPGSSSGNGKGEVLAGVDVSGPCWEALLATARRAALVVTEDMPVDPDAAWLAALVRQLQTNRAGNGTPGGVLSSNCAPDEPTAAGTIAVTAAAAKDAAAAVPPLPRPGVWAVDTACIVPMQLVSRAFEKAYAYRSATEGLRRQRLRAVYGASAFAATAAATAATGDPRDRFQRPLPPVAYQEQPPTAQRPTDVSYHKSCFRGCGGGGPCGGSDAPVPMDLDLDGPSHTIQSRERYLAKEGHGDVRRVMSLPASTSTAACGGGGGGGGGGGAHDSPLGCSSLDLLRPGLDLGALAAALEGVDCSVRGVLHLEGGSHAGYARWEAWRYGGGVARYGATRNDAMQRSGTSRMSPYLHWGMVSPFRIAREAAASGGAGASKFLDELLVWRELSYNFCFHRYPQLESLSVLPRWAQDTLAAHADNPRVIKTLRQLEAGETGDAFWDAAQRQLASHGELHNNVRMTWGKAPIAWCSSPQRALDTVLHLNHRYALDGCDPGSYGGVLWCFGLFDGPKEAASTPVTGTLRRRPTMAQAKRLNPVAYAALPP